MKLPKTKIIRFDNDGETELTRSLINEGMISWRVKLKIDNLIKFVKIAQKGERQLHIQTKKFIKRYSKEDDTDNKTEDSKLKYYLYLNAVEYAIYELNRLVEIHHHQFIAHIDEDYQIDLLKSPKIDECKDKFKNNGIYISKIKGYNSVFELKNICNDLKHSYIQEYALSKTLKLKSFHKFDRKMLVDKVSLYFNEIPKYIESLALEINTKYPKIEKKIKRRTNTI